MVHGNEAETPMSGSALAIRFAILAAASAVVSGLVHFAWGLNNAQTISVTVFLVIILATLFFWSFRLAIAFIGLPVLILTKTLELECFPGALFTGSHTVSDRDDGCRRWLA